MSQVASHRSSRSQKRDHPVECRGGCRMLLVRFPGALHLAMCLAERTNIVDQHTMCVRCEGSSGPRGVRFAGCVGRQLRIFVIVIMAHFPKRVLAPFRSRALRSLSGRKMVVGFTPRGTSPSVFAKPHTHACESFLAPNVLRMFEKASSA